MHKIYDVTLTVLSPLHIGKGNDLSPLNFVIKDNIFYRFELHHLISRLSDEEKQEVLAYLNQNQLKQQEIRLYWQKLIKEKFERLNFYYQAKISSKGGKVQQELIKENLIAYLYQKNMEEQDSKNQLLVKEFVGHQGKKYIPGSSLKGAIRTALINEVFYRDYYFLEKRKKVDQDYFKALMITDSQAIAGEQIMIANSARASKNNFLEVLPAGTQTNFQIKFLTYLSQRFAIDELCAGVNNFYKQKIDFMVSEMQKHNHILRTKNDNRAQRNKIEKNIREIEQYEKIKKVIGQCQPGEFVLNLGFGGGAVCKSFNSPNIPEEKRRYQDKKREISLNIPLTRAVVEGELLGWVKCTTQERVK